MSEAMRMAWNFLSRVKWPPKMAGVRGKVAYQICLIIIHEINPRDTREASLQ